MRIHVVNLVLLVALFAGSAWAWPHLPDPIPAHFNAGGEVTRWDERSLLSWYGLPLLALATVILNYAVAALVERRPRLINLPDKKAFLDLPRHRRAAVVELVRKFLYELSAPLLGLFGFLQFTIFQTARGADPTRYVVVTLVTSALLTPLILLLWLPPIQREVRRQTEEHALDVARYGSVGTS